MAPCGVCDVGCTSKNLFYTEKKCVDRQASQELVLWNRYNRYQPHRPNVK